MRGYRSTLAGSDNRLATRRCRRCRSRLARLSYATSRSTSLRNRHASLRPGSGTRNSTSSSSVITSLRGSATSASSAASNAPRANTDALRIRSRAAGESESILEAITAWTVGGSGPVAGAATARRRQHVLLAEQHPGDLDDEQRVPTGMFGDAERVVPTEIPRLDRELHGVIGRERLDPERHGVGEPARPTLPLVQEAPARDADHQQRQPTRVAHQSFDQVQQQRLGRMQILEHQHDRAVSSVRPSIMASMPRRISAL